MAKEKTMKRLQMERVKEQTNPTSRAKCCRKVCGFNLAPSTANYNLVFTRA
ncbi:hypothetical protein M5D96_001148 [Drosophila gunungcola]|uniref:Uncharacterized protein n=1 Tax=Drosophila gunungcola TaxID=103775 RepID=A0A9P9YXM4_9MUSC|nr:hypothetical protein M5D96_001148 [Drosophila gunungcola]